MNDSALFTDEPAPATANASLFTDEPAPKSAGIPWSEVPGNVGKDVMGLGKSVLQTGKRLADPFGLGETVKDVLTKGSVPMENGIPQPILNATEEPAKQAMGIVKDYAKTITHPIESFKEHPVGTTMMAAPLVAPFLPKGTAPVEPEVPPVVEPKVEMPAKAPVPAEEASDVFAAPLKGYSAPYEEARQVLKVPEYAEWGKKIGGMEGVRGQIPVVGSWEGVTEPSVIIKASPENADMIGARIGSGIGSSGEKFGVPQDGVLVSNRYSKTPNGTIYEVRMKSPEAVAKWHTEATKYGISGHTVQPDANILHFVDHGDTLRENIGNLIIDAHKAGDIHGFYEQPSEIKLLGPKDYPAIIARGASATGQAPGAGASIGENAPGGGVRPVPPSPEGAPSPQVTPSPAAGPFANATRDALTKANEVKDYISRGYEGFAKKPGNIANVADYVQSKSQMMALQQMGFTPGQIRNLGKTALEVHNAERAIGQYGLDSGIVSETTGLKGMVERNAELLKNTGDKIGRIRDAVDKAGPAYQPGELLQAVKAKLDPIYQRGVTAENPTPRGLKGTDSSAYRRALEEIEDAHPSHGEAAEVATRLNKEATQATKMSQNPGPYTDVANAISEINNERIKAKLSPEAAAQYEKALREFGVNKKIQNGLKYKSSGEVKRFGPGSVTSNLTQKAMDEFGYKVGAKVANKVSTSILKNPAIAKNLPSLFKEFINQTEDVGHEVSGMSDGGQVPPAVVMWMGGRS